MNIINTEVFEKITNKNSSQSPLELETLTPWHD